MFALILDRKESRAGTKYYSVSCAHKRTGGAVFWGFAAADCLGERDRRPARLWTACGEAATVPPLEQIPGKVWSGFPLAIAKKQKPDQRSER
ncbi:hypothetical protein [Mesorhizobium sp. M0011]|uniref:hypothetical protein n=1 Tax=unclassified Mesorhizobium TaxID=325217 RepID=UPI003337F11B